MQRCRKTFQLTDWPIVHLQDAFVQPKYSNPRRLAVTFRGVAEPFKRNINVRPGKIPALDYFVSIGWTNRSNRRFARRWMVSILIRIYVQVADMLGIFRCIFRRVQRGHHRIAQSTPLLNLDWISAA